MRDQIEGTFLNTFFSVGVIFYIKKTWRDINICVIVYIW